MLTVAELRPLSVSPTLKTIIKIANPVDGGQRYTSGKRALHFIRQGRAELTDDGQLFFFEAAAIVQRREEERIDAEIVRYRSGIVHWNGSVKQEDRRGPVMHRPGEVRS